MPVEYDSTTINNKVHEKIVTYLKGYEKQKIRLTHGFPINSSSIRLETIEIFIYKYC